MKCRNSLFQLFGPLGHDIELKLIGSAAFGSGLVHFRYNVIPADLQLQERCQFIEPR